MKVFGLQIVVQGGASDEIEATTPYPTANGFILRLMGGDVVHPLGDGDWFKPPYFARVLRFRVPLPVMPFFSVRIGRFGFYIGSKVFGVDSPAYAAWMVPEDEVYEGSLAMMLCSIRFTRRLGL